MWDVNYLDPQVLFPSITGSKGIPTCWMPPRNWCDVMERILGARPNSTLLPNHTALVPHRCTQGHGFFFTDDVKIEWDNQYKSTYRAWYMAFSDGAKNNDLFWIWKQESVKMSFILAVPSPCSIFAAHLTSVIIAYIRLLTEQTS